MGPRRRDLRLQRVHGHYSVRDYIIDLHATMVDARTRKLIVGEENAYLEDGCASTAPGTSHRVRIASSTH
jgi:hypothetical protein